ncbi:unnamed protein product [Trichobilharzia szidati]|nr:unnamed protein product [Trichobilharzia szidati]
MSIYLKYFGILLFFLVNICRCQGISCFVCDFCQEVYQSTTVRANCAKCATGGANNYVSRACLGANGKFPPNFPLLYRRTCQTELCNREKSTNTIENPVRCYSCSQCTTDNQRIVDFCGACVTSVDSGFVNKYCNYSCGPQPMGREISCCTSDLCNGKTKLSMHSSAIILMLILTGISAYML